ncbi:MAG: DUF1365 domain-containing protein [Pseudomonadota bacterium]
MQPTLFLGQVMHARLRPRKNRFLYPVFYVQLPLRHLLCVRKPIFSLERWNILSFCARDHGPRDGSDLVLWIENILREHHLPYDGEIVLQCFPRVLGYVFNPVSFWFVYAASGSLIAVLAEVNNTFGENHRYLLHNPDAAPINEKQVLRCEKRLLVSPFNHVEGHYRFRFCLDRARPLVRIDYVDADGLLLRTALSGLPHAWSGRALLGAFVRMPLLSLGVSLRIHWQALRLWLKGVPFVGTKSPVALSHSSSISTSDKTLD